LHHFLTINNKDLPKEKNNNLSKTLEMGISTLSQNLIWYNLG
jgi:hypothetical protein